MWPCQPEYLMATTCWVCFQNPNYQDEKDSAHTSLKYGAIVEISLSSRTRQTEEKISEFLLLENSSFVVIGSCNTYSAGNPFFLQITYSGEISGESTRGEQASTKKMNIFYNTYILSTRFRATYGNKLWAGHIGQGHNWEPQIYATQIILKIC